MQRRPPARPSLTVPLRALIRDVARQIPQLSHVRARNILVVAGEARRASHASVRPMAFPRSQSWISPDGTKEKPRIRIRGEPIYYVITLRPIWFRSSSPEQRVATLIHELFHCSARFDGTLHPARRHARMGKDFGRKLGPMVRAYLRDASEQRLAPFRHKGLVRVRMWLENPPTVLRRRSGGRKLYTEEQLYVGLVRMR